MNITSKTTRKELAELLEAAEARAEGTYHELVETQGKLRRALDARVDRMGENKPWKVLALGFAAGAAVASLLWVVV